MTKNDVAILSNGVILLTFEQFEGMVLLTFFFINITKIFQKYKK